MKNNSQMVFIIILLLTVLNSACKKNNDQPDEISDPVIIADNLLLAEGPAFSNGELYFTDIDANRIYRWNKIDALTIFSDNSGRANGLYFDNNKNLIACEGGNKRIVSISPETEITIISDRFKDTPYNEPNDVWISPVGNIYFTDPVFTETLSQDGQNVYCVLVTTGQVIMVADDLVKPNGITGNKEGSILYIADYGSSRIYKYNIMADGTITGRQLFAPIMADGLDTDTNGNLYVSNNGIMIYNSSGVLINIIQVSGVTTNSCIVEDVSKIIFVTTHHKVYKYIIN